ncbi:guanine nucleotide binding protein, alpha subunit [Mycena galericulata]|nr:guanine nucleotide binding protein, alpha subunit [Mycena galericulata]
MLRYNIPEILRQRRQQRTRTDPDIAAAISRSEEIDSIIRQELQNYRGIRRNKSVLVLGGPNSGKATFIKQARLFGSGFSDTERDEYKSDIHKSVINTVKMALDNIPSVTQNSSLNQIILSFRQEAEMATTLMPDISGALVSLWEDERTRAAIFNSAGSVPGGYFPYFMDSINRIVDSAYTPTDADILRHKLTSPPLTDTAFSPIIPGHEHKLNATLTCVHRDIGLQRKWISFFFEAWAIVFLVDLSSYDEVIISEDGNEKNGLREAMKEFEDLCMHPDLRNAVKTLVMNKMDLFATKLTQSPLSAHFPDYRGADEPIAASEYLIARYTPCSSDNDRRDLRVWRTSAIDSDLMSEPLRDLGELLQRHFTDAICWF